MRSFDFCISIHSHAERARLKLLPALLLGGLLVALYACGAEQVSNKEQSRHENPTSAKAVEELAYKVLAAYPHDPNAFTQGLVYQDQQLFESRGLYGRSSIARLELSQAQAAQLTPLGDEFFGEGLAIVGDELVQLTWKSGQVFRYKIDSLQPTRTQSIAGQGWGLTSYQGQLVSSDGSATLSFRDPNTLAIRRQLDVTLLGRKLEKLNELETVQGYIASNILQSTTIVFIDPSNGIVKARINLARLLERERTLGKVDVVNGIAYKPDTNTLLVTGKLWHHIYEIQLTDALPAL